MGYRRYAILILLVFSCTHENLYVNRKVQCYDRGKMIAEIPRRIFEQKYECMKYWLRFEDSHRAGRVIFIEVAPKKYLIRWWDKKGIIYDFYLELTKNIFDK